MFLLCSDWRIVCFGMFLWTEVVFVLLPFFPYIFLFRHFFFLFLSSSSFSLCCFSSSDGHEGHAPQPKNMAPLSLEDLVSKAPIEERTAPLGPVSAEQIGKQSVIVRYLEVGRPASGASVIMFCTVYLLGQTASS